jgi:aryl sulfotransferase
MVTRVNAPTREYRTVTMNSHHWDDFAPRADDIIIGTYPKCGTTWTQRIVDLLVFQSPEPRQFFNTSVWLDCTFFAPLDVNLATLEAQSHRRFIKTHLPLDSVPVAEGTKVVHVARDGRDACLSMHNHQRGFRPEMLEVMAAQAASDPQAAGSGRLTPEDPRDYFLQWMDDAEADSAEGIGVDLPFLEFEQTYWRRRKEPWLLLVNYADLKTDLAGEMRRISDFLEIETPASLFPQLVEAATFETMKRQGDELLPQLAMVFDHGAQRFINKGTNGRWKDVLTADDLARYDALVRRKLSPSHAAWIEKGRLQAGDPASLPD